MDAGRQPARGRPRAGEGEGARWCSRWNGGRSSDGRGSIGSRRAESVAAGPAQGPHPAGPHRRRGAADRRGPRGPGQHRRDHRGGRHRLRSFYNHFDSKEELFQTASEEVLERWGQLIDRASAGLTDPAELFAVGTRITGRLGWTHPDIAGFLTGAGLDVLDIPTGLVPRALRDIEAGQATGRFTVPDPEIALSAAVGGMLGLLRMCQRHPERVNETTVDELAEAELRLLGVPADEAARLVALPLPAIETW